MCPPVLVPANILMNTVVSIKLTDTLINISTDAKDPHGSIYTQTQRWTDIHIAKDTQGRQLTNTFTPMTSQWVGIAFTCFRRRTESESPGVLPTAM